MDSAGTYPLASLGITAPLTAWALTPITSLDGMSAFSAQANFAYGSGGTTVKAKIQTTFDGGTTWLDVVEFDFATESRLALANVVANSAVAPTTYTALSSEGVNAMALGNQLRVTITSTGTYANTSLSLIVSTR